MPTKEINPSLNRHLRQLHGFSQNSEEQTRRLVQDTKALDPHADKSEVDFKAFAASYADLLLSIRSLTASNKEMEEALKESISNKVANAIMVSENMDILAQIDYIFLANQIMMILDYETVEQAVLEMLKRGPEGREKIEWLNKALKRSGGANE